MGSQPWGDGYTGTAVHSPFDCPSAQDAVGCQGTMITGKLSTPVISTGTLSCCSRIMVSAPCCTFPVSTLRPPPNRRFPACRAIPASFPRMPSRFSCRHGQGKNAWWGQAVPLNDGNRRRCLLLHPLLHPNTSPSAPKTLWFCLIYDCCGKNSHPPSAGPISPFLESGSISRG